MQSAIRECLSLGAEKLLTGVASTAPQAVMLASATGSPIAGKAQPKRAIYTRVYKSGISHLQGMPKEQQQPMPGPSLTWPL